MRSVVGIGGAQIRGRREGRREGEREADENGVWPTDQRRRERGRGTVRRVGGKKFEEGKQKRFGLDGKGGGEDGRGVLGSVAFYGIAAESS